VVDERELRRLQPLLLALAGIAMGQQHIVVEGSRAAQCHVAVDAGEADTSGGRQRFQQLANPHVCCDVVGMNKQHPEDLQHRKTLVMSYTQRRYSACRLASGRLDCGNVPQPTRLMTLDPARTGSPVSGTARIPLAKPFVWLSDLPVSSLVVGICAIHIA